MLTLASTDPFSNVLVYEQSLSFQWQSFQSGINDAELSAINITNEQLLQAIHCMDEHSHETEDVNSESVHEFQRLEAKVDLLLRWVGQSLTAGQSMPDKRPVKLSENGLSVEMSDEHSTGDMVLIRLFLMAGFPEPLQLPGEVVSVDRTSFGFQTTLVFRGITHEVKDEIEKFIFRKHRRMIALQKKQSA